MANLFTLLSRQFYILSNGVYKFEYYSKKCYKMLSSFSELDLRPHILCYIVKKEKK